MMTPESPREVDAHVHYPPCPECGNRLPDETVWIVRGKFYCSERCAWKGADK